MRLPYAPATPPDNGDAATSDIYARIAARRHPRPLIPLDRALLHAPPVADGWNSFLGAIRSRTVLHPGLLELAVCRVAVLNAAVYEWNAHAPLAVRAGIAPQTLAAVRTMPPHGEDAAEAAAEAEAGGESASAPPLSRRERAVVAYTDQMTRTVRVDDAVFDELRAVGFSEREIVELTATVAAYNCVSRFLVALDVGEWNAREMKSVDDVVREEEERKKAASTA
ncbi:hypothetical protein VTO42DRAFT_1949 [Malbranchea cinnamomea]